VLDFINDESSADPKDRVFRLFSRSSGFSSLNIV
jgi:hypothetical protein